MLTLEKQVPAVFVVNGSRKRRCLMSKAASPSQGVHASSQNGTPLKTQ